jgi:hypothetical protein
MNLKNEILLIIVTGGCTWVHVVEFGRTSIFEMVYANVKKSRNEVYLGNDAINTQKI